MNQRELADILAPIVCPVEYDVTLPGDDYVRAVYGEEAADRYMQAMDYRRFLAREGRRGEFILRQAGCEPPYEESVPRQFKWLTAERIEELKTGTTSK